MTYTDYTLQASAASNLDCSTQIVLEQLISQAELESYIEEQAQLIDKEILRKIEISF